MGVSISDFKTGDKVYSVLINKGRINTVPIIISKGVVIKVGKKYVHAEINCIKSKFEVGFNSDDYLTESVDWGVPRHLFKTEEDARTYIKREELKTKLLNRMNWAIIDKFTLDQLERIDAIIKEAEDNDN